MITLARVDERLIHGQVAYAWTMVYPSDAIIVVDQEAEKDALQRSLLEMACPRTMKCFIANDNKSVEILKKYHERGVYLDGRTTPSDNELDLFTKL